ncbi:MAG: choice-of-anchor V domain-containing protein [Chitinophagales bacterium]
MRKSTIALITFTITAGLIFRFSEVKTNIIQPPSARTGAPGELTCGTSDCHNNTPNSGIGSVSIAFSDPEMVYVPGNTYTLTVVVNDETQTRFGFELTSLNGTNAQAGTFAEISGGSDLSFPISTNGRLYTSHHNASSTKVWNISWTAPITDVGPVTFYAGGNAANNNDESTGDHIYTSSLQILADNNIGIEELTGTGAPVVQFLTSKNLSIHYETPGSANTTMLLYSINGQMKQRLLNIVEGPGMHTHSFNLENLSAGLYLLQLKSGAILHTEKIIID